MNVNIENYPFHFKIEEKPFLHIFFISSMKEKVLLMKAATDVMKNIYCELFFNFDQSQSDLLKEIS